MVNHWISELPEFGASLAVLSLLEEQRTAREEIEILKERIIEIDNEIFAKVKTHWTAEEISKAQKDYQFNRR